MFEKEEGKQHSRSPSYNKQHSPLKPKPITSRHPSPIKNYQGSSPAHLRHTNTRNKSEMRRHKSVGRMGLAIERDLFHPR